MIALPGWRWRNASNPLRVAWIVGLLVGAGSCVSSSPRRPGDREPSLMLARDDPPPSAPGDDAVGTGAPSSERIVADIEELVGVWESREATGDLAVVAYRFVYVLNADQSYSASVLVPSNSGCELLVLTGRYVLDPLGGLDLGSGAPRFLATLIGDDDGASILRLASERGELRLHRLDIPHPHDPPPTTEEDPQTP